MGNLKTRNVAALNSFVAAGGSIGVVAVTISAGTLNTFLEILPSSPRLVLVVFSGVIALFVGCLLSSPICLNRKSLLIFLLVSSIIFLAAAIQVSIVVGFVLFWPWSLYRLYRDEISNGSA